MVFEKEKTVSFVVTISIGISQYSKDMDIDTLISSADKNLYLAKKNGRNCIYPPLENLAKKTI